MPIFYFNVVGGDLNWTDLAGKYCDSVDRAREEAERLAGEIVSNALLSGNMPPDANIEVEDDSLRPVLELPITRAIH